MIEVTEAGLLRIFSYQIFGGKPIVFCLLVAQRFVTMVRHFRVPERLPPNASMISHLVNRVAVWRYPDPGIYGGLSFF